MKMSTSVKMSLLALAVLMTGTTVAIIGSQQNQENRSRASGGSAPIVETTASARASNTSVLTFAHNTNANPNRMLLVGVSIGNRSKTVASITYAGVPLKKIARKATSYTAQELWYLAPVDATGVNNVVVTLSGSVGSVVAGSTGLSNVNQENPFASSIVSGGSYNNNASVNLTASTSQLIVDTLSTYNTTASQKAGLTTLWNLLGDGSASIKALGAGVARVGSGTVGWTLSNSRYWAQVIVVINSAGGPIVPTATPTPTIAPTLTPTPTPVGPTLTPTPTTVPVTAAPVLCPACNFATYVSVGNRLSGHDFTNAFFPAVFAPSQNLSNSNFTGVAFNQSVLTLTNMTNSNFTNADFTGADLNGATTTGATFTGATWNNTTCPDGTNSTANGGTCEGHL